MAYSAKVELWLTIDGVRYGLSQVMPDRVYLRESTKHKPTNATITVSVDGREKTTNAWLPDGIDGDCAEYARITE